MFWIIALILVVFSFATQGFIQIVIFMTAAGILIGVAQKRALHRRSAAAVVDRSPGEPENEQG